jgi:hypothetical protein
MFELTPSQFLSQNEIDAAKSVRFEYFNAQEQPKLIWPATFSLVRAYVDQLGRNNGLPASRLTSVSRSIDHAEQLLGQDRQSALDGLSLEMAREATASSDEAKVKMLAVALRDLARAPR